MRYDGDKTMMSISSMVRNYYDSVPIDLPESADIALMWVQTELGEVYEILLTRKGPWERNHPDDHPTKFDLQQLGYELGDVLMMIIVAGLAEGIDIERCLEDKIKQRLARHGKEVPN